MTCSNNEWIVVGSKKNNSTKNTILKEINDYKKDNYKKILCKNIMASIDCIYGDKCLYAHDLSEQKMDHVRKIAYDMIMKDMDLRNINIALNKGLYNTFIILSRICEKCEENVCTGGYNCKHGACRKKYIVCQNDLNKGTCLGDCNMIHLTAKGLVPYCMSILLGIKCKTPPQPIILNDNFFKNTINSSKQSHPPTHTQSTPPTHTPSTHTQPTHTPPTPPTHTPPTPPTHTPPTPPTHTPPTPPTHTPPTPPTDQSKYSDERDWNEYIDDHYTNDPINNEYYEYDEIEQEHVKKKLYRSIFSRRY